VSQNRAAVQPAHDVAGFCGLAATIDGHDFTALPQVTAASVVAHPICPVPMMPSFTVFSLLK
jgi:hypothetical protein